jgi:hypothetical protein
MSALAVQSIQTVEEILGAVRCIVARAGHTVKDSPCNMAGGSMVAVLGESCRLGMGWTRGRMIEFAAFHRTRTGTGMDTTLN